MTTRRFFRKMLFGRFTDESKVANVVSPAFSSYLSEYISMMDSAVPDKSSGAQEIVKAAKSRQDGVH
jgi:hypothetical protein